MAITESQQEQSKRLHALAVELRGNFLGGTTWVEPLLSDIIAGYFCGSSPRRSLFFSEVAHRMPFERKSRLICLFLKHEFPNLHANYPNLERQLDELRGFRNVLAHAHIDTSEAALSIEVRDEVTFVTYKDGERRLLRVTCDDAATRADEANQLRDYLQTIQQTIARGA